MTVRQAHAAPLVAQERQSAGAVEQSEETACRRVHRAQHHGVRRCQTELHGVEIPPAAPERGLHHRMHDRPPKPEMSLRVSTVRVPGPPTSASMHGPRRSLSRVVHRRRHSSYKSGARSADRYRTVPETGLPRVQRVTSGRARRPTAPRRKATAQHDEPAAERLAGERDRGPQERATAQNGLRVPRGRPHRRAHSRSDVRGGGAALGDRHARQAGRAGKQTAPR